MRIVMLLVVTACGGAYGALSGSSGPVANWTLEPNHCAAPEDAHMPGTIADLYEVSVHPTDTEMVVRDSGDERQLLIRVPNQQRIVVLRPADCTVFDIHLGHTGYTLNDEVGRTGEVHVDCTRPEIGHVTGSVSFTCF